MRKTEADFERKAREEGWTVLKNGWPDYLLLREESGKLYGKGAEVKGIYRHFNSTRTLRNQNRKSKTRQK